MNNPVIFNYIVTDELVNIVAGFMDEVSAVNWSGQRSILLNRDHHIYAYGEKMGMTSKHDGRYWPGEKPAPRTFVPDNVVQLFEPGDTNVRKLEPIDYGGWEDR